MDSKALDCPTLSAKDRDAGERRVVRIGAERAYFRWCRPGMFRMGSPKSKHEVTLSKGFWIMETPVTVGMFKEFVLDGYKLKGRKPLVWEEESGDKHIDFSWNNPLPIIAGNNRWPATCVIWEDAEAFCKWLSKEKGLMMRLPTEAEWEYAARGRDQNEFPWENENVKSGNGCFYANFKPDKGNYTKDGNLITSKAGIYSANTNGLYDMAGNVAEWTSTIFTESGVDAMNDLNPQLDYKAAKEDPYRLKKKSVRGGSWKDPESYIRSAWRTWEYQNQPRSYIGFRCVRSLASSSSEAAKQAKKSSKKKK